MAQVKINIDGKEVNALKVRVKVNHIEPKNGAKFDAYKVLSAKKRWIDLRFTQDVENKPKEDCYIYVEPKDINYTTAYLYPRFWCKRILKIEPIAFDDNKVCEYFDEESKKTDSE